jgi:hypothetical protein
MHGLINVKFPNNISKWQMGFNSAFKGLSTSTTPDNELASGTGWNNTKDKYLKASQGVKTVSKGPHTL